MSYKTHQGKEMNMNGNERLASQEGQRLGLMVEGKRRNSKEICI